MDIRKTVLSKHMQFPPTGKSASGTGFGNKIKNSVLNMRYSVWDVYESWKPKCQIEK